MTVEVQKFVFMLGSCLKVKEDVVRRLISLSADDEATIETILCIYDGMDEEKAIEMILKVQKNKQTEEQDIRGEVYQIRHELIQAKEKDEVIMQEKQVVEPEQREEEKADVIVEDTVVEINAENECAKKQESIMARLLSGIRNKEAKEESPEMLFKKYADLLKEDMSEEQQMEIINAINIKMPYNVIKVIARKDLTADMMRYLSATYLKMSRESEKKA